MQQHTNKPLIPCTFGLKCETPFQLDRVIKSNSASPFVFGSIPPGRGDDRSVKMTDFQDIQTMCGQTFTLDAFSDTKGINALVNNYCHPLKSFLRQKLHNEHVWINSPFHMLADALRHYQSEKARSPDTISACILVPKWPDRPWSNLLQGMRKIKEYPIGYPLFQLQCHADDPIKQMRGIPWPVEVYYEPCYDGMRIKAASENTLSMQFSGSANGAKTVFTADSGASASFVDRNFAWKHGFSTSPTHRMVTLADGSAVTAHAECTIYIRIHGNQRGHMHSSKISCFVVDLGDSFDVILGENWLKRERAELSYNNNVCRLFSDHRTIELAPLTRVEIDAEKCSPFLTAVQVKRHLRKGGRCFIVNVVDSATSPFVLPLDDVTELPGPPGVPSPILIPPGLSETNDQNTSYLQESF